MARSRDSATLGYRSDNGREFDHSLFRDLLIKQGIIVEFTSPYTPEQNVQVERLKGPLMGLVRSMLLDSGPPMRFWSDALAVATFVLNRRPHPRIQGKTAIEVLLGKKLSLAHLQPFGSTAFVHVPEERRTKLAPRSSQGVLLGYSVEYNYGKLPFPFIILNLIRQMWAALAVVPRKDDDNDDNAGPDDGPDDYHDAEELLDSEAKVALAPREDYPIVRTGPNPGQLKNVNPSNVLPAGSCHRPQPPEVILPIIAAITVDFDTPPMFHDKLSYDAYCAWHEGIWVLGTICIKGDARGNIIRFTARLVSQGFTQRPGMDYHNNYAPVARPYLEPFDFDCAFLNGKMAENVYVRYPKG
ncbi:BQ5605_C018g08631 [Microbotryum silenes-dioicae]|uniref:BQ5605_C018g08631 protein n=1 Tax=Microbotryum silenes-dioicae TaxID=796604 RepID=A0A2X0NUF4_9BASI|nr:BQ5605_C018g08631 [Microbotryum silenes-dioicae]